MTTLGLPLQPEVKRLPAFNMVLCISVPGLLVRKLTFFTGKSVSEALIFASTNPQYDDRLNKNCKLRTCLEHVVHINCSEFQNKNKKQFLYTTCSDLVIFMY